MADKPNRPSGYPAGQVDVVRTTCLYVATKLGDLADETVIVGGLVPSLSSTRRRSAEPNIVTRAHSTST
jgi:hypothetical protein